MIKTLVVRLLEEDLDSVKINDTNFEKKNDD